MLRASVAVLYVHWKVLGEHFSLVIVDAPADGTIIILFLSRTRSDSASATAELPISRMTSTFSVSIHRLAMPEAISVLFW